MTTQTQSKFWDFGTYETPEQIARDAETTRRTREAQARHDAYVARHGHAPTYIDLDRYEVEYEE